MMLPMRRAPEQDDTEGARVIPISDRVLFERHRRGDPAAFPALLGALRARVFGYLTRCGVSAVDRDDLFQEVFLRVHRAGSSSGDDSDAGPSGPLAPWVMTITVNVVRSHFRKASVRSVVTLEASPDEHAATDRGPESALAGKQTTAWLEQALLELPLEQREALLLCSVEGLELADAARALGAPLETVKTRLRRARVSLAEARSRLALRTEREESR